MKLDARWQNLHGNEKVFARRGNNFVGAAFFRPQSANRASYAFGRMRAAGCRPYKIIGNICRFIEYSFGLSGWRGLRVEPAMTEG